MPIVNRVADLQPDIQAWRRDIHENPELLYDVHRTAAFVADRLREFGCDEVATGLGIESVPYFTRNTFGDRDLIAAFLAMHVAIEEGRDVFRERELLIGTFGRLFQRHGSGGGRIGPTPRDQPVLKRVKERMRADYAENLRLEDLAQDVGLTPFQLIGLFKRATGLAPHAYLTQVRLDIACRHLRHARPISQVATDVGFYDQSALTKHFKRCYGITPLQFARAAA